MTPDDLKALAASGAELSVVLAGLTEALAGLGADIVAAGEAITEAGKAPSIDKVGAIVGQIAAARRMMEVANQEAGELLDVALYAAGVSGG